MSGQPGDNQFKSIVSRINTLEDQRKAVGDDIKDVYAEAKGVGYDTKALRATIRRQRADAAKLAEHEQLVETYMAALGMI